MSTPHSIYCRHNSAAQLFKSIIFRTHMVRNTCSETSDYNKLMKQRILDLLLPVQTSLTNVPATQAFPCFLYGENVVSYPVYSLS